MHNLKTVVLLAAISGLLIAVGGALGGLMGVIAFAGIALAMNIGSYWASADIVLRSSHAKEIAREDDPQLFRIIEDVARRAEMPMPRLYVMDSPQPNAFATGRNPKHAAVAVTTGIRELLTDRELRGVLGHEMAHVKNHDILTSSVVATIATAISLIAFISLWFGGRRGIGSLIAALVAPLVATLIQLGISRSREYQADRDGATMLDDPQALASALEKLHYGAQRTPPMQVPASTAHMFILNPLRGGRVSGLLATHPPLEERIKRLREMSQSYR